MNANSESALASVLLTSHLFNRQAAPLSTKEFWDLIASVADPARLLGSDEAGIGATTGFAGAEAMRISTLLEGAMALAIERERLEQSGIRVTSTFDDDYPSRLFERLRESAPPVLHIAGPTELLSEDGIGIVGSRNVAREAIEVAEEMARAAVKNGVPVVSGAARGIDQAAMGAAVEAEGKVVGLPADAMNKLLKDPSIRRSILEGHLCLATPYAPSAGFSVGTAMSRNKLIYALSRVTLVVASDEGTGGTWAGATEALQKRIAPVAVWMGPGAGPGNAKLARQGAVEIQSIEEVFQVGRDSARAASPGGAERQLRLQF
jgi:predicted Rossmann fold nucleotide-binding protein DprA/Smf involved in DNA uptake